MKTIIKVAAFAATTTLLASSLQAATAQNTMGVSATVSRTCTVSADALAFTSADITAGTSKSAGVAISCTAGSSTDAPTVTFSGGGQPNATTNVRQMKGGDSTTALIPYTLSEASGGTNVLPTTAVATTKNADGTAYSKTIYGRVEPNSNYQIGTFNDTVTVTVTYAQ